MTSKIIEGKLNGSGKKVAIVASRFNSFVVERLIEGSVDCLIRHGVDEKDITVYKIPGAFEFPSMLSQLVKKNKEYNAIICLGVIIKGETPHFDFVAAEATKGIAQVAMNAEIPIGFGLLTTENLEQAIDRAGAKSGNKGFDAAFTVLEMIDLYSKL